MKIESKAGAPQVNPAKAGWVQCVSLGWGVNLRLSKTAHWLLTFLHLVRGPCSQGWRQNQTQVPWLREQLVHLQAPPLVWRKKPHSLTLYTHKSPSHNTYTHKSALHNALLTHFTLTMHILTHFTLTMDILTHFTLTVHILTNHTYNAYAANGHIYM